MLGAVCLAVLCGTLWAGLWPFHSPKNAVNWLGDLHGVRFRHPGTIVSAGQIQPATLSEPGCSIELWVQPGRPYDSSTLLAFYSRQNPIQFSVHQTEANLVLEHNEVRRLERTASAKLYVKDVLRVKQPVFLSISSGSQGTAIYVDGRLAKSSRQFAIARSDCTGRLVVGTAPMENDGWTGVLYGLAIYHGDLSVDEVVRHYQTWTTRGSPEGVRGENCAALYLFTERAGNRIHNQMAGVDLLIPERYMILDKFFLEPFWKEFDLSSGYWKGIVKNIAGLIPLGFCAYAWLLGRTSARRAAWMTTLLGCMVSITIEVLQGYLPTRQSGTTDILTNTFGTWLGVVAYRRLFAGPPKRFHEPSVGRIP